MDGWVVRVGGWMQGSKERKKKMDGRKEGRRWMEARTEIEGLTTYNECLLLLRSDVLYLCERIIFEEASNIQFNYSTIYNTAM